VFVRKDQLCRGKEGCARSHKVKVFVDLDLSVDLNLFVGKKREYAVRRSSSESECCSP
jgi:hypothetical protein